MLAGFEEIPHRNHSNRLPLCVIFLREINMPLRRADQPGINP